MKKALTLCVALLLVGCANSPDELRAIMYNPETKDTKECVVDPWSAFPPQRPAILQQCVDGYVAAGYKRVDN